MRETDTHIYFWGSYLSNFAWAPFRVAFPTGVEIEFTTSEQCYMAFKALEFEDHKSLIKIFEAPDAKAAKALGRTVKNFDVEIWDKVSEERMYFAAFHKFNQNPVMKYDLIDTKDKILVEASPLDKIWGVGLHEDDDLILDERNWLGENRLGKVLMKVRAVLSAESQGE